MEHSQEEGVLRAGLRKPKSPPPPELKPCPGVTSMMSSCEEGGSTRLRLWMGTP